VLLSFAVSDDRTFGLALRLASVILLYPLIIIGGANIEPKGITMKWAKFSGDLSYPLYILHIPLLSVASAFSIITGRAQEPSDAAEIAARFIFVIALSWIALKVYDEPLRRLLAQWTTTRQISSSGRPIDLSDTRPPTFPALAKEQ
jgi:peptidoglycan/LPS O-acetylase OafA/YrhL